MASVMPHLKKKCGATANLAGKQSGEGGTVSLPKARAEGPLAARSLSRMLLQAPASSVQSQAANSKVRRIK